MNFEEYLNETLEEGTVEEGIVDDTVKAVKGVAMAAGIAFSGILDDVYKEAPDNQKPLSVLTKAIVDFDEGGQDVLSVTYSLVKRSRGLDADLKDELLDYGIKLSTVESQGKRGIQTSQYIAPIGQNEDEVMSKAMKVLEMIKDDGQEDVEEMGELVTVEVEIDGDDWFVAYPENLDLGVVLKKTMIGYRPK